MAYNAGIILQGRAPDIMGSLMRGQAAAGQQNALRVQNDLTNLYREQGAGIMSGDQNALNALAAIDPMAAMDMRGKQQAYRINEEQLKLSYEQSKLRGLELAQTMDANQRKLEAERVEKGLAGAAVYYKNGQREKYDSFLRQNGVDPAQFPFDEFPAHAASLMGLAEALKTPDPTKGAPTGYSWNDPNNPAAGVTPLPGYERSPNTVVNVNPDGTPGPQIGTVPQGFSAVPDRTNASGYRLEAIPGGPADTTRQDAKRAGNAFTASESVTTAAERALEAAGNRNFGPIGQGPVSMLPWTDAAETDRQVRVLRSQAIVSNLQAMRDASPTGGALGAVSAPELQLLADQAGALDPSSPAFARDVEDYTKTLLRVIHGPEEGDRVFNQWKAGMTQSPPAAAPPPATTPPPPSPEAIELLRQNPTEDYRQFFDEIFGQGMAARILGGN